MMEKGLEAIGVGKRDGRLTTNGASYMISQGPVFGFPQLAPSCKGEQQFGKL